MRGEPEFESRCYRVSTTAVAVAAVCVLFVVFLLVSA